MKTIFYYGEAKRRKNRVPPREKPIDFTLPKLDKNAIQKECTIHFI